jgi:hypothetical protein
MATGGRMEFANGESECVCDVGYSGDACETLWMPNVPDPCVAAAPRAATQPTQHLYPRSTST